MIAIFKKEFKSFFNSMIGWCFIAVNLFFAGWYFRFNSMINGYPYISYILSGIILIYLCSVPFLTMRTLADESKNKTDQLLFTSPVSVWKIVFGKYLALVSLLVFILAIIGLYQLVIMMYGSVPVMENFIAIIGFLMFGMTCLAIGLFLSSITDNQIIAAVLTFFVLMVGIMIPGISNLISVNGNWITKCLSIFNLTRCFQYFLYGIIYLPAFLYYFSVILFMLFLTIFVLERKRMSYSSHGLLKMLKPFLYITITATVLILINYSVRLLPLRLLKKDITYNSIYSITDESRKVLKELDKKVDMYVLVDGDNEDSTLKNTIEAMAAETDNLTVTYVSPSENPYFYTTYSESNPTDNSIIVVCDEKSKVVDYYDCYEMTYDYEYDYSTGNYVVSNYSVTGYDGEGRLISAIDYVTKDIIPKIYAITGHDEFEMSPSLQAKFDKENIDVQYINLLTYDFIPADADCIMMLGPLSDYSKDEITKIDKYLKNGGNALFIVSYTDSDELYNYYSLLKQYNIKVNEGLIMEQGTSFYNTQEYFLLPDIVNTPITEDVYSSKRNKYIYMPFSKGMTITTDYNDVNNIVFLQTTENAYALTDLSLEGGYEKELAQFALGVFAEKNFSDKTSRIIAFSSDYFLYEDVNLVVNDNNYIVFMKAINQIINNTYVSDIPVKGYSYDPVIIDETARTIASILVIGIIPAIFILTGLFIVIDRRKK